MQFIGLAPGALLAAFAAASAVIIGLYVLRLRRRTVAVPFAKLWNAILRDKDATTLFSRLKKIASLLLQLALLALLVLALGDPRTVGGATEGRSIVVLVDASASMSATDVATAITPRRTRLDAARDEVRSLIRSLGPRDRLLLAQMDAAVAPVSTMTQDPVELEAALERIGAVDAKADFPRALRFAQDTLRGLPSPEIVVVSDGALGPSHDAFGEVRLGATKIEFVPVGKRGKNVAITEFTVRRYPLDRDRYEVMLELFNASDEPVSVELDLLGDGRTVDVTKLKLGANERLPRFYANLSGARRTLEAVVKPTSGEPDDLAADDHAYALIPDQRRVRVHCVTKGNTYLEAALLLTSYLDVTYLPPESYPPHAGAHYDVTIFDGVAPVPEGGAGELVYLNPPSGAAAPIEVDPAPLGNVGFDTIDKKSPLLRWTSIEDVFVAKAHRLKPQTGDRVIGSSDKGALMLAGKREGRRFVALGFDPRDSDLVLRVAWPVLVLNIINELSAEDAAYLSGFKTGEPWRIPLAASADEATIIDPLGHRHTVPVQDGRAVYLGQKAGFYTVEVASGGGVARSEFAANLSDAGESMIAPEASITVDGVQAGPVGEFHTGLRTEWWALLLLIALALTTIEWVTYHRRVTV
jgi:hypothetical protein